MRDTTELNQKQSPLLRIPAAIYNRIRYYEFKDFILIPHDLVHHRANFKLKCNAAKAFGVLNYTSGSSSLSDFDR